MTKAVAAELGVSGKLGHTDGGALVRSEDLARERLKRAFAVSAHVLMPHAESPRFGAGGSS